MQIQIRAKIIKFRALRNETTCYCNAYPFPHRAGSGKCDDPGKQPSGCGECKYGKRETDPYGTGDRWFSQMECCSPTGDCQWEF